MKFYVSSQKSKIFHLDELNTVMILKSDAKFKEKLTYSFKHDIRNLVNFHPTTQKFENFTSRGCFCPKYKGLRQKKYKGAIFHDTEL